MPRVALTLYVVNLSTESRTTMARNLLQGARHAVLGTLCARANRIGLDGTSCLLNGLRKNVSFSFFVVVDVCALFCPASEVVVLAEQQLQGFGDPLRANISETGLVLLINEQK